MVSVIIPTYGGGEGIERTLDSLFAQSYQDFEVIVVDDNGADHPDQLATRQRLEPYLQRPNFCYVVSEENAGGSHARNLGAGMARGEYLMFLDDDDAVSENKLEKQVQALQQAPERCALSYTSSKIFAGGVLSNTIAAKKSGDLLYDFLMSRVYMGTGSVMLKSTAWQAVGGYDESFLRHQDLEFFARILNTYDAVAVPDAYFLRYITNRNLPKAPEQAEACADHYIAMLRRYPFRLTDRQKRRVINRNNSRIALQWARAGDLGRCLQTLGKYDNFFAAACSFAAFTIRACFDKLTNRKS